MKVLLLALALVAAPHDFFVSILTVRHVAAERTLDLTWRITAHDIEHALLPVPLALGSAKEHPDADSLLNAYFGMHLTLIQNGRPLAWKWLGKELDGEILYCYLQVENAAPKSDLTVMNTLLHNAFAEQQNMVHLEVEHAPTRSYTFRLGCAAYTFPLP
jgi:hypothetical protein